MGNMNYYELLDVPKSASQTEIKRAYFGKVRQYSPEKDPVMFKKIREAYDTLSDEKLRKEYDPICDMPDDKRIADASKCLSTGDIKQAIRLLKSALASHPESKGLKYMLAQTYEDEGQYGNAIKLYKNLSEIYPDNTDYAFHLALCLYMRGYRKKAQDQFDKISKPGTLSGYMWMQWILVRQQFGADYQELLDVVQTAETFSKDMFKEYYRIYGILWMARDKFNMVEKIRKREIYYIQDYDFLEKFMSGYEASNSSDEEDEMVLITCLQMIINSGMPNEQIMERGLTILKQDITSNSKQEIEDIDFSYNFWRLNEKGRKLDHAFASMSFDSYQLKKEYDKQTEENVSLAKSYFLRRFSKLHGEIIYFKNYFPDLYKLNEEFFEQLLDPQQRKAMERRVKNNLKREWEDVNVGTLFEEDEFNEDTVRRAEAKVGRNDSCPCGSGKKYKKCCGK